MIHRLTIQSVGILTMVGLVAGFAPAVACADVLLDFTTGPGTTVGDQLIANVSDTTIGDDTASSYADFTLDDSSSTPVTLNVSFTGEDGGVAGNLALAAGANDQLGVATALIPASDTPRAIDEPDGDPSTADEAFTFSFTKDVALASIGFGGLDVGEVIDVTIDSFTHTYSLSDTVTTTQAGQDNLVLTLNQLLSAGQTVTITAGDDGNAANVARFGIASLTVGVVPEPATLTLLGLGAMCVLGRRERGRNPEC